VVVPLGVIAALYMREYAKQGFIIGLVRIAVNNLAGVPSIVYGVFGLGFFCYSVGNFVDRGPTPEGIISRSSWWIGLLALSVVVLCTIWISLVARAKPGQVATRSQRTLGVVGIIGWAASAIGAIALITGTPYFHGFFEAHPSATFGTRGMLWAALTLALLTLPVVIVATEEAIAAVPRTMREGSYGCGASKWQTIRRIVLPRAMPGIMTGMILAMARGAGEVAPLMLVGAVKLAPELPISSHWPFIHLERSFMHLGFHIYDVGFQSPDSEAARPLVWTTTLVLIALVLLLNVAAIRIRTNLRRKFTGGAF
jgi:ABC-type phosphate transport system permease subunit